ncbi:MBL fold metallo-hydrolase [Thermococcus sp. M39]|uniref:MBL fold metallo-hydrolase n=1 Tax=unclassified Thermococcus TaxID=2627626 RepID=UPI00143A8A08|nr:MULTISPECIES: MBL fold metallo-hydrolase [unclassified Thermococcus]NJE08720.1 MBL fold metallo-hydrolase [Thermococcus sp. M39]NJE12979.1 MBL fold metallo-hydrolase [Thermococcus sp. LS2]
MKKLPLILMAILVLLLALIPLFRQQNSVRQQEEYSGGDKIIIVYDNKALSGFKSAWGFAAVVRFKNYTILFDTGGDGEILLGNIKKLDIDPKSIQYVFLSHIHGDHTGGLWAFLRENPNVTVFLPSIFPDSFKEKVRSFGAKVVEIDDPKEILKNVYSTGVMSPVGEQALVLKTSKGLVVVTGCSHPGIVKIVERAENITGENAFLVVGGFHLFGASEKEVRAIATSLKKLGVQKVMPCHCTGSKAERIFAEEFGVDYVGCGVGKVISW